VRIESKTKELAELRDAAPGARLITDPDQMGL